MKASSCSPLAETMNDREVAEYLLANPEFFAEHAEMLATMFATGARIDEVALNGPGQPIALPFEMADVVAAVSGFRPDD